MDYYVSKSGRNGASGTQNDPFLTINEANDAMSDGDTCWIEQGTYNEQIFVMSNGVTFRNVLGHIVTLDGSSITIANYTGLFDIRRNGITIDGIRTINGGKNTEGAGIFAKDCANLNISNCYSSTTGISGFHIWNVNGIIVYNSEVTDACYSGSQEGISLVNCQNFEISYNYVHNNPVSFQGVWRKEGIDCKVNPQNGLIHHNTCSMVRAGIYIDSYGVSSRARNIEIYNNRCYECQSIGFIIDGEEGYGTSGGHGGNLENIKLFNNLSYKNGDHGFYIGFEGTLYEDIYIINNVSWDNAELDLQITRNGEGIRNLVVQNNVFDSPYAVNWRIPSSYNPSQHHFDHNVMLHSGVGDYIQEDPEFINPPSDFGLQDGSPCIGAGSSENLPELDFNDNTRTQADIGAIGYNSTPPQEIPGCTDPEADNYNPDATIDNGSCVYSDDPPVTVGKISIPIFLAAGFVVGGLVATRRK